MKNCIVRIFLNALFDSRKRYSYLASLGLFNYLSDEVYLRKLYYSKIGRQLDLNNPQTFNEKLQWLKLYDRKPEYTTMVDKYAAKKYVADKIGEQYLIPTLGVWNHFDEIDFDKLPNQFVLKCTHDSGGLVICKDKSKLDKKAAKAKIEKSLQRNYYWAGREWPYKNVPPRIIAEQYMQDDSDDELTDYKFMMFNGEERCAFVCTNRYSENGLDVTFYDTDWEVMPFERHYPRSKTPIAKPQSYETMIEIAKKLSKSIPFVRIDFYEIKGKPYFGEITFFPGSGFEEFSPDSFDETLGKWIKLPNSGGVLRTNCCDIFFPPTNFELRCKEIVQKGLTDYKFYCFNGQPKFLYASQGLDHHATAKMCYLDLDWQLAPFQRSDYAMFDMLPQKPAQFEKMVQLAALLSEEVPFLRVDLYEISKKIYFSELTLFPGSGFSPFEPDNYEKQLGTWIELPNQSGIKE